MFGWLVSLMLLFGVDHTSFEDCSIVVHEPTVNMAVVSLANQISDTPDAIKSC